MSGFSFHAASLALHHFPLEASGVLICSVRDGVESRKVNQDHPAQEGDKGVLGPGYALGGSRVSLNVQKS